MPIDSRQVTDLQVSAPSFVLEPATKGDKVKLSAIYHQDDNSYHLRLTTPEIPEVVIPTPEPQPDPIPTTVKELYYYTPDQIIKQVRTGMAAEYWPVGSTISFKMNSFKATNDTTVDRYAFPSGTVSAIVIGYDHNLNIESPDYSHTMTFMVYPNPSSAGVSVNINTSGSQTTQYAYCSGLASVNKVFPDFFNNFYNAIPNDWKKYVIPVIKSYTPYSYNSTAASNSTKVFTLSYDEVFGTSTTLNGTDAQYDYFKTYELSTVSAYATTGVKNNSNYGFVVASRSTTTAKMTNLRPLTTGTKSMLKMTSQTGGNTGYTTITKDFTSISYSDDHPCIIPCFTIG